MGTITLPQTNILDTNQIPSTSNVRINVSGTHLDEAAYTLARLVLAEGHIYNNMLRLTTPNGDHPFQIYLEYFPDVPSHDTSSPLGIQQSNEELCLYVDLDTSFSPPEDGGGEHQVLFDFQSDFSDLSSGASLEPVQEEAAKQFLEQVAGVSHAPLPLYTLADSSIISSIENDILPSVAFTPSSPSVAVSENAEGGTALSPTDTYILPDDGDSAMVYEGDLFYCGTDITDINTAAQEISSDSAESVDAFLDDDRAAVDTDLDNSDENADTNACLICQVETLSVTKRPVSSTDFRDHCHPPVTTQDEVPKRQRTGKRKRCNDSTRSTKKVRKDATASIKTPDLIEKIYNSVFQQEPYSLPAVPDLSLQIHTPEELHKRVWLDQQRVEHTTTAGRISLSLIALYWYAVTGTATSSNCRVTTIGVLDIIGSSQSTRKKIQRFARSGCRLTALIQKIGWEILLSPVISMDLLRDTSNKTIDEAIKYLDENPMFCQKIRNYIHAMVKDSDVESTIVRFASEVSSIAEAILHTVKQKHHIVFI
jgi:hypothetical protein